MWTFFNKILLVMFLIWLVQLLVIYRTFDKNNKLIVSSHWSLGVTMTTLKIYGDARNICDNPPRKIPYYRLRPIHFGRWAIIKYHPVVSCRVNARYITWNSNRGSTYALKLTRGESRVQHELTKFITNHCSWPGVKVQSLKTAEIK
jgi:hypothetical protein